MRIDTCANCLLDNHMVISEQPEKSVQSQQIKGIQKDKAPFAGLQKHSLFVSFFMIEDTQFDYFVQYTWWKYCKPYNTGTKPKICLSSLIRKYVLERLSSYYLTIRQCSGISAERHSEKRHRLSREYHKYQNQLIKLEFIFHFIHTSVYAYTNRMLQTRRLSRVFLADRKV